MFERLGSFSYRFRYLILVAWVLGAIVSARLAPSLAGSGSTDQASFLPAGAPSVLARDALERAFPGSTANSSASITFDRPAGLTDADRAYMATFAEWTTSSDAPVELRRAVTGIDSADTRPELDSMLRSEDGRLELLIVNLDVANAGDEAALVVGLLRDHLADTTPPGLETHVTGAAAISTDYLDAIKAGTDSTTAVTVLLVLVILLLIYRAPLAALVPLVTIGCAFMVSRGTLGFLAAAGWQVSSLLDTFLVVMVFGVGTDYAIFLISRYREEVSGGGDWHDAARTTVKRIGAVITASAATVIVGMTAMAFGEFEMVSSTGPAIAVAILVTLIAGLTLAPALLSIFGHYLFWPLHTRPRPQGEPGGFFARLAAAVSHHPGIVTVALLAALLLPATFLPRVATNFDVLAELPAEADSRVGYEAVAEHLGEDKLVQSTGLMDAGGDGDMLAPASLAKLRDLMASLRATPGVASATSLVTPDGDGVVPDGFRPSKQLATIGDGMAADDGSTGSDSASLLDPEVSDGLDTALAYVGGLALAYPDVAGGPELRAVTRGIADAQDIIERAHKRSVLSTQLRTLASSMTSPAAAGGSGDSSSLMSDYLDELAVAYPDVRSLEAFTRATAAAASLEQDATITAALDLAAAFERLAIHFDDQPDATLSPESLSDTSAAREIKREAETVFGALPDQFTALAAVFATRPDDIYIPTTLTGEDGDKLRDAVDAFVSRDRTATRFYVTNANDPYSGGAFVIIRSARDVLAGAAPAFGSTASAHLGGPTAQFADVEDTMASDFNRVGVITVLGILLVLALLLRAVVAPLYLVGTVLVSYGSAVGLSAWFFQEVLGQPGVSFYLPLMVFVLLVALGSDYNIFLMSRVREESEHRPIKDGIRIASGHTGAVITSAGLILAGTFGSMASAPLAVLFQVGVAVAVGVLIDTFVVRSILVPAITTLVGNRAWWPSGAALKGALGLAPLVPEAGAGAMAGAGTLTAAGPLTLGGRSTRARLAVALSLVVLVPVTVAGLLTWSMGGSSANLALLEAAVVDLDQGGTVPSAGGTTQQLSLGADLAAALVTGDTGGADPIEAGFSWGVADEADATAGLADGRYAAVLTIPADFSRTVAALRADATGRAPRATLRLVTDDGSGYALGTIARQVAAAIGTATARNVTASYVDGVLLAVTSAHDALARAADDAGSVAGSMSGLAKDAAGTGVVASGLVAGLRELADGADQAVGGARELLGGTRQLADGASKLTGGATDLATGARTAADGAASMADGAASLSGGLATLMAQTAGLPGQADALASGADGVSTGAAGVASGASALAAGLDTMAAQTAGMGAQAQALDAGAADLASGAAALSAGADQAAVAAADLATGAGLLSGGMADYTDNVAALAGSCVVLGGSPAICAALDGLALNGAPLASAADDVATGAGQLAAAGGGLAVGAGDLSSGATTLHEGTHLLAASAPVLEAGVAQSATGAAALAAGAFDLGTGAGLVADGSRQLADGMPALADGIATLADGGAGVSSGAAALASSLDRLADGATALASGARASADGAQALADGTAEAADGIDQLTGAIGQVTDGAALVEAEVQGLTDDGGALADEADALAESLRASTAETGTYPAETRARMGSLAADPVAMEASRANAGAGPEGSLAPLVMAIAAWLGALAAFLVLPAMWPGDDRRWWRAALLALARAAGVTIAGGLMMTVGVRFLVGVEVARTPELLVFVLLASLAFTVIVQALVILFGSRGWLVALLFLVVQVAASGVTLGSGAIPGPLAALRPFLPLSHAIDAFRNAIAGGAASPAVDAAVLVAWLVVALLVSLAAAAGARMFERPATATG